MKQAEQLFVSADAAGHEIKPILLYYGLNQATRAVAAMGCTPKEKWAVSGHGITIKNLDQGPELGELELCDQGNGGLQTLAKLCQSPTLARRTQLADIWLSLPEGSEVRLSNSIDRWSAVRLSPRDRLTRATAVPSSDVWSAWIKDVPVDIASIGKHEVERLLYERFPALRALKLKLATVDGVVGTGWTAGGPRRSYELLRSDAAEADPRFEHQLERLAAPGYRADKRIGFWYMPCLPGNAEPLHTLVCWWVLLYSLSMLARYQPALWTKMLDIDSSPDAPGIEYLLDEAHTACVNLVRGQLIRLKTMTTLSEALN